MKMRVWVGIPNSAQTVLVILREAELRLIPIFHNQRHYMCVTRIIVFCCDCCSIRDPDVKIVGGQSECLGCVTVCIICIFHVE